MSFRFRQFAAALALVAAHSQYSAAISPDSIMVGKSLFEREWSSGNPSLGSDGLGPLFNGASCLTCHNQGGAGGGGAAEFNAKTIGIESLEVAGGTVTQDSVSALVRTFHPGFQLANGTLINTCSITHHGGTPAYQASREKLLETLPAEFSKNGGPVTAEDVRRANAFTIQFQNTLGKQSIKLNAKLFQRNTTALFGAGLLDQVPDKVIRAQMVAQKKHPEISGRPSTLRDGRYGKFGWRANLASLADFTDQACANEVGLKTRRRDQPNDPTAPTYRNPTNDITDQQVLAIRDFTAALPAPVQRVPEDSLQRLLAQRGEQVFSSIGCAVCHVPDLGPAKGAYTDLLLHEMGYELRDLNHAEPYIQRTTPVSIPRLTRSESVSGEVTSRTQMTGSYYGSSTAISTESVEPTSVNFSRSGGFTAEEFRAQTTRDALTRARSNNAAQRLNDELRNTFRGGNGFRGNRFLFTAPEFPSQTLLIVDTPDTSISNLVTTNEKREQVNNGGPARIRGVLTAEFLNGDFDVQTQIGVEFQNHLRVHFEPTRFNEEWRTPPLWGVADSAPYMHDGRAETLLEAITMHGGESEKTRDRFLLLEKQDRDAVIAFLETLRSPF